MEAEFREIDEPGSWSAVYQEIRQQSSELPCKLAKLPENKSRNRYRDVSPFDHSRIRLQLGMNDYINASLITVEEAERKYILTQGPLPNTCGHFWEMVWEQRTVGVVMLNRVVEKGSVKCAQYWPHREEGDAIFEDTNFKLTLLSEDVKSYYTVRQLELQNLSTEERREILHFHYTTWPDFGVPDSPASFLNFLVRVRESGCLRSDRGPVVVHCSAGIGRSGTFCLVDTCLLLMSIRQDPSSVRIRDVLLEMRRHRMGLIQTADQLRFSYLAVIEGARLINGDHTLKEEWKELSNEEDLPPQFSPPPPPPRPREPHNGQPETETTSFSPPHHHMVPETTSFSPPHHHIVPETTSFSPPHHHIVPETTSFFPQHPIIQQNDHVQCLGSSPQPELRRRTVAEAPPPPAEAPPPLTEAPPADPPSSSDQRECEAVWEEQQTSQPQQQPAAPHETEKQAEEESWSPLLANVCVGTALAFGAYVCYRVCFH